MNIALCLKYGPIGKNMGLANYCWLYGKIYFSSSAELIQKVLNEILALLISVKTEQEKHKLITLFDLCLSKGARLELPALRVKTLNSHAHENSIRNQRLKEILENLDIYDFLLKNPKVSLVDKCKLDSFLFQSMMADLVLLNYKRQDNYLCKYIDQKLKIARNAGWEYSALEELEAILNRSFVFKNQISTFLVLSSVLSYREIFDNLGTKFKLICFREFSNLSIIAKKALTSILIKNKNEEALYNLLSYGLKLNWDVQTEEGKTNLVAFELLYSIPWIKTFIINSTLDIRITNSRGENILHLIGSCALEESAIEVVLRRKLTELPQKERDNLFFQLNEENLTPLMKAVIYQDEKLIDFILSFNVKPWDKLEGAPLYESAMEFLNLHVLSSSESGSWGTLMNYFKDSFWEGLARKWNSEYYYLKLQKEIVSGKSKNKKVVKV